MKHPKAGAAEKAEGRLPGEGSM